ncbi:MAG: glycosyltransferase family 2 protein [Breznakibacter sp.]
MSYKIAVLIIFFEKLEQTIKCVKSFAHSDVNIYVLNNGSSSQNWQKLQSKTQKYGHISFIHSEINLGPARGRNILLEKATEEWLFLVDNDITIRPKKQWVEKLKLFIQANADAKIILPRLYNVYENQYCQHPVVCIEDNQVRFVDDKGSMDLNYFPSGAAIVHRSVFEELGNFDTQIFAFEDYEFAIRALKAEKPLHIRRYEGIELIHDHKYQRNKKDQAAVLERYNNKRLLDSFRWIEQKHQVLFEHEWEGWSRQQVVEMTQMTFLKRQVRKIQRLFYK